MMQPIGANHISPAMMRDPAAEAASQAALAKSLSEQQAENEEAKELYQQFVGETFFGQMMKSMRKSVGKSAYFDGGKTEEIFQQQLDRVFTEEISKTSAADFSGPMFDLFMNQQRIGG